MEIDCLCTIFQDRPFAEIWQFEKGIYCLLLIYCCVLKSVPGTQRRNLYEPREFFPSSLWVLYVKIIYFSSDNSLSHSWITLSHSHDNLVLKCLQCHYLHQIIDKQGPLLFWWDDNNLVLSWVTMEIVSSCCQRWTVRMHCK